MNENVAAAKDVADRSPLVQLGSPAGLEFVAEGIAAGEARGVEKMRAAALEILKDEGWIGSAYVRIKEIQPTEEVR